MMAAAALTLPVMAGLSYLHFFGAPARYLAVNAGALLLALIWILAFPTRSLPVAARRVLIGALIALLFVPMATGPSLSGVERWLPLGPFQVHAGMLAVPLLAVLAGEEDAHAPAILSAGLLAALLQPDMATGAALTLAAFGLYDATKDWRYGAFAAVSFTASLVAAVNGELPAQPFADRVIFLLARNDPLAALGLLLALVVSFYLIVAALPGRNPSRKALAGCLFGFSFAGIVSNYPSPLIGFGAAPILGFGLALGVLAASAPNSVSREPRREN